MLSKSEIGGLNWMSYVGCRMLEEMGREIGG